MTLQTTYDAKLGGTRKVEDGYLIADAYAVRTGIQLYRGKDVDPSNEHGFRDKAIVRVYRSEEEVRDVNSLRSFSHAPVTVGHPKTPVNDSNWKKLAVGEVSTEATWQDNKIRIPLVLKDSAAIKAVEGGTRELSAGYKCRVDFEDGISPEGEQYDAVQRDIRINHIAIVPEGRAGHECRIGDEVFEFADEWGVTPLTTIDNKEVPMSTKIVVVGDQAVSVTVEDAPKLEAFLKQLQEDHQKEIADLKSVHDKAIGDKDGEITKKVMTDAQISERAAERQTLMDSAVKLAPTVKVEDLKSLSDADIRRAVLCKRMSDSAVKDRSDDWVQGVWDSLSSVVNDKAKTPDRVLTHRPLTNDSNTDATFGQESYITTLQDAWKGDLVKKES